MPNTNYVAAVMASVPRAYYQCQEAAGLPQDSSGNALPMTAGTAFAYQQAGPMGDFGIRYSGGQGHTRAQVTAVVNNVSIEFWFRGVTFVLDGQHLIVNHAAGNGYLIGFNATGKWFVVCPNVGNGSLSAGVLTVGVWKHVVVVRDAGTWKYYLNGVIDTANAAVGAPIAPSGAVTGIHNNTASLDGVYAHVAIYETALSAATVAAHYAAAGVTEGQSGATLLHKLGMV